MAPTAHDRSTTLLLCGLTFLLGTYKSELRQLGGDLLGHEPEDASCAVRSAPSAGSEAPPADPSAQRGHLQFLVVGAGPAGLQYAILMQEAGMEYAVLEKGSGVGSFFRHYPRARRLISVNKLNVGANKSDEFALRHDWHSLLRANYTMSEFSNKYFPQADELVEYLETVSQDLDGHIELDTEVLGTRWDGRRHVVRTNRGVFTCDHLVMATGYRMRDLPECMRESGAAVYTYEDFPDVRDSNEEWCRNKAMMVMGSGNAAFETADMVANCAKSVSLVYKNKPRYSHITHYVGDVRIHNAGILDRYQLKSLDALEDMDMVQDWSTPDGLCKWAKKMVNQHNVDAFVFAGGFTTQRTNLVNATLRDGKRKFPDLQAFWSSPESPQTWFGGAAMHGEDFRVSAGGFVHGFRYAVRSQFRFMRLRHLNKPWPSKRYQSPRLSASEKEPRTLSVDPQLPAHFVGRIQEASGLYQMQDFLVDVIEFSHTHQGAVRYYEEVPKKWLRNVTECRACMTIGFLYSQKEKWNFDLLYSNERLVGDSGKPGLFLHPILEGWVNGSRVAEIHVREDLDGEWVSKKFVDELEGAFSKVTKTILEALEGGK